MAALLTTPEHAAQWLRAHVTGVLGSDSRTLCPGDGFVATPGALADGRSFVGQALQRGAAACLVEAHGLEAFGAHGKRVAAYAGLKADAGPIADAFYGHPSDSLAVLAVTGTNGKTSTAWWLAQALNKLQSRAATPCAVVGTLGVGLPPAADAATGIADPLAGMHPTGLTTPDAVTLHSALHRFAQQGVRACALEASSIGIDEGRMNGLRVRVAVFTNFTQDHLDYHGSMKTYWDAKRRLFTWPGLHSAVINIDDAQGATLAESLAHDARGVELWTTSAMRSARLQAQNVTQTATGLRFDVAEAGQSIPVQSQVLGSYNVNNLLGVLAALRAVGVELADAVAACEGLRPVPGRLECMGGDREPLVVVDYAHTPDALAQTLDALRPAATQRGGRLWCVFGCGGDRDAAKRPLMGAIAAAKADQIVLTSDNPRCEQAGAIVSQILVGVASHTSAEVQVDRGVAIAQTIARAAANDVILVAGKGHEATQDIGGMKTPFSDRDHALRALQARPHWGANA
ncbi:MAG: UDP-N-acetylmuramoyl-L-alanyl-D-glutamate--2,6-diaminopimelate ligase [Betaproteobacteria bacterium]